MQAERSLFGKAAKYIFIFFNLSMFTILMFLIFTLDGADILNPDSFENEEKLSQFMLTGTLTYFLFFVWGIGDLILGVWVLCTRPKNK